MLKKIIVFKIRYLSLLNKEFFILNNKVKYAKFYYIMIVIFIHSEIILYTTFPPEQDLGEECFDTRQCKQMNPYSMCSVKNKCECIDGYTKLNNTCLPGKNG